MSVPQLYFEIGTVKLYCDDFPPGQLFAARRSDRDLAPVQCGYCL